MSVRAFHPLQRPTHPSTRPCLRHRRSLRCAPGQRRAGGGVRFDGNSAGAPGIICTGGKGKVWHTTHLVIAVTRDTRHLERSLSKARAWKNILTMVVTPATSQNARSWLKAHAPAKVLCMRAVRAHPAHVPERDVLIKLGAGSTAQEVAHVGDERRVPARHRAQLLASGSAPSKAPRKEGQIRVANQICTVRREALACVTHGRHHALHLKC